MGPVVCISNKFIGDADIAGSRDLTDNHWVIYTIFTFLFPLFTDIDYSLTQSYPIIEIFTLGFRALMKELNIGRQSHSTAM